MRHNKKNIMGILAIPPLKATPCKKHQWFKKLGGGFSPTHLKNMRTSNWIIFPGPIGVKIQKKYLSCHHLGKGDAAQHVPHCLLKGL